MIIDVGISPRGKNSECSSQLRFCHAKEGKLLGISHSHWPHATFPLRDVTIRRILRQANIN